MPRGREEQRTTCVTNGLEVSTPLGSSAIERRSLTTRALLVRDSEERGGNVHDGVASDGGIDDNARHAKEATVEATLAEYSAVASGGAARRPIAFREGFNGPARVILPPPSNHQCQGRNATVEARPEKRREEGF